jgi:hypothetical protein
MPRFVILEHDHPHLHWDLMLEAGAVLQTWRLSLPPLEPGCAIEAAALPDHRSLYLDYEGPLSGDRGVVRRWDSGVFSEESDSTPKRRRFSLQGTRIGGRIRLEAGAGENWCFLWLKN